MVSESMEFVLNFVAFYQLVETLLMEDAHWRGVPQSSVSLWNN